MITRRTHTLTYDRGGQRIRDQVSGYYLFGFIPLYTHRAELWRKAAAASDDLRAAVLEADNWQCVYCGSTRADLLSLDHRTPQSQGGMTVFENLLTACKACNSAKNGRTPEEANMPLVYGRFARPAAVGCEPIALGSRLPADAARVERVRQMLKEKATFNEILADVWSVKGKGPKWQEASEELRTILAVIAGS